MKTAAIRWLFLSLLVGFINQLCVLADEVQDSIAGLKDQNWRLRESSAAALCKLGDARAVEPLIACLKDEDDNVQDYAAIALGNLGDVRAVEPLISRLGSYNENVRKSAADALVKLGKPAVGPLIACLSYFDRDVRDYAAIALGNLGDTRAVEPLIACLKDPSDNVRESAAVALGKLSDARAVEPLIGCLMDTNYGVCEAVEDSLGNLKDTKAVQPLIARLKLGIDYGVEAALDKIADASTQSPKAFAQKASEKVAECKTLGDRSTITRSKTVLVWDLKNNSRHSAYRLLDGAMRYPFGDGPVTVFLVNAEQQEQVGTYSISKQPAYREWVDVYVVQFSSITNDGTPVAAHQVLSLDPAQERPVQYNPEYGKPDPSLAKWISSLPVK